MWQNKSGALQSGTSTQHRYSGNATLSIRPDPLAIAIASDHAGFEMKTMLAEWMRTQGHAVADLGPFDTASVDYPDYGYKLGAAIASGEAQFGVAVCGSGIGISIAVNRNPAARCALVSDSLSARLSREHNDANAIAFGARLVGPDTAKDALAVFLATPFAGDRHANRVNKLSHPVTGKESV
jgi:ribose 5-phosphate isomerase B